MRKFFVMASLCILPMSAYAGGIVVNPPHTGPITQQPLPPIVVNPPTSGPITGPKAPINGTATCGLPCQGGGKKFNFQKPKNGFANPL